LYIIDDKNSFSILLDSFSILLDKNSFSILLDGAYAGVYEAAANEY
jgi:hypothetical protein